MGQRGTLIRAENVAPASRQGKEPTANQGRIGGEPNQTSCRSELQAEVKKQGAKKEGQGHIMACMPSQHAWSGHMCLRLMVCTLTC